MATKKSPEEVRWSGLLVAASRDNAVLLVELDRKRAGQKFIRLHFDKRTKGIRRRKCNYLGTVEVGQRIIIRRLDVKSGVLTATEISKEPGSVPE